LLVKGVVRDPDVADYQRYVPATIVDRDLSGSSVFKVDPEKPLASGEEIPRVLERMKPYSVSM